MLEVGAAVAVAASIGIAAQDVFSSQRTGIAVGALVMGTGLVLTSFVHQLWLGYLTYGVGVGVGTACGYVPMVAAVGSWFDRRQGLAIGVAVSGIGIGTLAGAPAATALIGLYGWRHTYLIFGIVSFLVLAVCGFLADRPARSAVTRLDLGRSIQSREFMTLYLSILLTSFGLFTFFVHLVPYAESRGIDPQPAATLLAVVGVFSTAGRLARVIGESRSVLYRRSLYGGTTDTFMATAYREIAGATVGCCPGWRFGSTVLPGPVRVEDVYSAMKPTPSPLYRVQLSARTIRSVIEDNLDNVFNPDPLERLGGEVIRCLGVSGTVHGEKPRGSRLQEMRINDQAPEGDFVIATSGGRTQYRDPNATASTRPAVEELVAYIEAHPVLAAEPLHGLRDK